MFSVRSVHQVVILCTGGSHVTITHDALDFTVQLSPPPSPDPGSPPPLDIGPHWPWPSPLVAPLDLGPHWTGSPCPASDIWWSSLGPV